MKKSILCIGCGNMMNAIFRHKDLAQLDFEMSFYNRTFEKAKLLSDYLGGIGIQKKSELKKYDFIFLGVKPQNIDEIGFLKNHLKPTSTIVSLLAAIDLSQLQTFFSHDKITRLMPNLGAFVKEGVYLQINTSSVEESAIKSIKQILSFSGETFDIDTEETFDHLTMYTSCMPGVISNLFQIISEQMTFIESDPEKKKLLTKTLLGTAHYLKGSDEAESFGDVTAKVASKGGVTEALNKSLVANEIEKTFKIGFESAMLRSRELKSNK